MERHTRVTKPVTKSTHQNTHTTKPVSLKDSEAEAPTKHPKSSEKNRV